MECVLIMSQGYWRGGGGWKTSYCCACLYVVYMSVYVCVYTCVLCVYNLGVHGRFYRLNFKMEMVVLENKPWRSLD